MELDLLVDDIVDELALDDKLGGEVLEIPDLFRIYYWIGFDVRRDVLVIVLPLAPVPDPVFCEGPCVDREEKGIKIRHKDPVGGWGK
jgi:hypothetical protein